MKRRETSLAPLLIGLVMGLLALWASAAPVGATGDLITGGWAECWDEDDNKLAADSDFCDPCYGTTDGDCSENGCDGGTISVVITVGPGLTATPHAGRAGYCWGSERCRDTGNGECY